jgi:hypothetical protein
VTGVAALSLLSNTEDLSGDGLVDHEDVRLMLQMEAIDLGDAGKDEIYGYGLVNGAAASFSPEMTLTAVRTVGAPKWGTEVARVAGVPYEITITNAGLSRVIVDVFEGDVPRRDLSTSFHFQKKKPQEVAFGLDATGARYSVLFTPYGRPDASAKIVLRVNTQPGGR